ncbi:hypothetical protein GLAREA_10066 [Glarea lozoyensis ATCC 20868]|uniref:Uncharacterized protein n=1 Tax=Glarea lozoyensis (strain ATCC 20868 / MF5171) TaxID=1116229 RepID=S3D7A8_GLAL2|nr:uncharacterized protein GLAREA_10066 [Glarea lozoyensis ATCC 20868]EPE34372.1 hypothetical protein GLAREA_10066 [Glarea lozoyensis ATCC 20868]
MAHDKSPFRPDFNFVGATMSTKGSQPFPKEAGSDMVVDSQARKFNYGEGTIASPVKTSFDQYIKNSPMRSQLVNRDAEMVDAIWSHRENDPLSSATSTPVRRGGILSGPMNSSPPVFQKTDPAPVLALKDATNQEQRNASVAVDEVSQATGILRVNYPTVESARARLDVLRSQLASFGVLRFDTNQGSENSRSSQLVLAELMNLREWIYELTKSANIPVVAEPEKGMAKLPSVRSLRRPSSVITHGSRRSMDSLSKTYPNEKGIDDRVNIIQNNLAKYIGFEVTRVEDDAESKERAALSSELKDLRRWRKQLTGHTYPPIVEDEELLSEADRAKIAEYMRIVRFTEDVLSGRHPRVKIDTNIVLQLAHVARVAEADKDDENSEPNNQKNIEDPTPIPQLFIDNPWHPVVPDIPHLPPCINPSTEVESITAAKARSRSPSLEIVSPDEWIKRQKPKVVVELSSDASNEDGEYTPQKANVSSFKPDAGVKVEKSKVVTITAPKEPRSMRTRSQTRVPVVGQNRLELDMRSLDGTERQLLSRAEHSINLKKLLAKERLDSPEYIENKRKLANIEEAISSICSKLGRNPDYDKRRLELITAVGKMRANGMFFTGKISVDRFGVGTQVPSATASDSASRSKTTASEATSRSRTTASDSVSRSRSTASESASRSSTIATSANLSAPNMNKYEIELVKVTEGLEKCKHELLRSRNGRDVEKLKTRKLNFETNQEGVIRRLRSLKGFSEERLQGLMSQGRERGKWQVSQGR